MNTNTETKGVVTRLIRRLHQSLVFDRRRHVLARTFDSMVPEVSSVLDVGCGDGTISYMAFGKRPGLRLEGLEVMVRPHTMIPVSTYDGCRLPLPAKSWDVVLLSDVLHHDIDPEAVMNECRRVAGRYILIKDHFAANSLDFQILKFMDWVGNRAYGVRLIYNYWSPTQWHDSWQKMGVSIKEIRDTLTLYPFPINALFGRKLHFVVLLEV